MKENHNPFTPIQDIARIAKEVTLKQGFHVSTLISEGDKQTVLTQIEAMAATHEARARQLFVLGLALARSGEVGVLQQVFFITEGWMSVASGDQPPHLLPSQDPERKEILAITRRNTRPRQTEMLIYEMKRNKKKKLVALEDFQQYLGGEEATAESPLLEAFVSGFFALSASSNLHS